MKTSAVKSSTTSTHQFARNSKRHFFAEAGRGSFFPPSVQRKMNVGKPGDKFEQEADKMAGRVMRANAPETDPSSEKDENIRRQADERLQKLEKEKLQKQDDEKLQRSEEEKLRKEEQEKLQQAPEPEKEIQRQEEEEKLRKQDDEKIQKNEEEKLQKEEQEKLQQAPEPEKEIQRQEEEEKLRKQDDEKIQKNEEEKLQRKEAGTTGSVSSSVQSAITGNMTGGEPLSNDVRSFMEPRFNADFSNIRIHSDREAASLNNQLSARAFTYRNHIFFSRDRYQPGTSEGKHLLAHELTHTIQQGHAVQRSSAVSATPTQPHIQRSAVGRILDWIADKARYIPGFRMFTIVLGVNPINMDTVDRSASNILRALVEFLPGGTIITQALDNHGVFNKVAGWIEGKIKALGMVGSMFSNAISDFIDSLGLSDLAPWNWGSVWERAKLIFTAPINRLISFANGVITDILKFVKDAILKPLAAMAKGTRGYDLLCALLGADPITGEPVPRTADTLIGGFMKLIGQEEIWENLKKGNAVARAWAWFQGALAGLLGFARSIPQKIIQTLTSLTFQDIITVAGAFTKIVKAFVDIAGSFMSWAFNQVLSLLEILFSVVAPGAMPYLKKAKGAFAKILKNPIGFVGNLVRAAKTGFQMFAGNIVKHLKTALIKWIVGPLADAGVYIPKSFSLFEIIKLVLSVLGLTWQNIRKKLVKIIPEPVLVGLEKTAGILVTLVKDGPAAAWEQIKAELSELKEQLISQITQMVSIEVVKAAVLKLVSMINPAGAVVQAIIAIYNTITFFIEKINQIAAVVASFIDSISAIAAGQVGAAAKKVEMTMANTLTVVISFLAKFAGLGGIPKRVVGIIKKIRKPIDKGLDKIVAWLGKMLKKMGEKLFGKKDKKGEKGDFRQKAKSELASKFRGKLTRSKIRSIIDGVYNKYKADGLRGVVAKPIEGKPDQYESILIASKIKVSTAEGEFDIYTSDLDLGWPRTVATGMLKAGKKTHIFGPHRNDGTKHAEEHLIREMNNQWENVAQPKSTGITNTLTLNITRSPCGDAPKAHNCANKINQFAAQKKANYLLDVIVRVASIYGGKHRKASKEAIQKLVKSGIQFTAWDLIAEIGDDTGDVKKETLDKLQKRIDSTKENLPIIIQAGASE